MKNSNQRTILITAPGSGIGKSIVENLIQGNYRILAIGGENSKKYVEQLDMKDKKIDFIECDYSSEESVIKTFEKLRNMALKIDGVIHLAGGSLFSKNVEDLNFKEYKRVLSLNLDSSFLISRESFKWMKETGGGNIILFGSTTGLRPSAKKLPYGVAKAGVHAMVLSLALEGSKYNIITNGIAPGYVLTDRHIDDIKEKSLKSNEEFEEILAKINIKNPLNQSLRPHEIFPLIELLLTTKHIQGQIIRIDSGQTLG